MKINKFIVTFDIMAYVDGIFCLSRNGEEPFNKLLSPDPDTDHLRGGGLIHR